MLCWLPMLVESDLLRNGDQTTEKVTVLLLLPPSGILFPLHNRAIRRCKILQVNDGGRDKGSSAASLACLMNAKATLLAPSLGRCNFLARSEVAVLLAARLSIGYLSYPNIIICSRSP